MSETAKKCCTHFDVSTLIRDGSKNAAIPFSSKQKVKEKQKFPAVMDPSFLEIAHIMLLRKQNTATQI